ncbi:hypothetical protein CXB41_27245 [Pseudomonas syringae pv. syringae]|nr:hypothetical protein CXB41_27245 [Pseudomonas syringae pv. syringae]
MQFSTLCVARGRRASGTAYDAERRTIVEMIVPHAPCGNAVLDALRRQEDAERLTMALTWRISLQTGGSSPDPLRPPASSGRPC